MKIKLSTIDIDRIIEMAWEDRTPFEAIETQYGLNNNQVIKLMRSEMKPSSFRMWRKRTQSRSTKHLEKRPDGVDKFRCSRQPRIHRTI